MRLVLLALLCSLLLPASATAEVTRPGTSEIRQDGPRISWVLGIPADELASRAGGDDRESIGNFMSNNLRMSVDNQTCAGGMSHATPERFQGAPFTRVYMRFECPHQYGEFAVINELLLTDRVDYDLGGTSGTFRFDLDHSLLEAKTPEFPRWLAEGFEAIAVGWEHALFLAILLLGARSRRQFGEFAAAFTGASVLGLFLGVFDVVNVSERVLEGLTVASIVGVAALPVLGIGGSRQLAVVFGLALMHGLALAVAVPDTVALPGFAVGVVLGTAVVVSVAGALALASQAVRRPSRARGRMPA
ncbi:HupE/UreJ family protein [Solirubrobacter sp. CPCC 204708]|uniref:HupE/UreJ family protein n=1 Tax=Solirubrobacter deserti TaxID=2282478 RepID=A0ABT4RUG7_9ACTN|nr:HupE/UreJ family protein [Solirubrobacter deserti]MBE2316341.1 HupE/UreJ family protein [Solirubrobacter deserti]MDA0142127.1 HupE/UreJ family protein [Solirubrobacter deserti]